MKTLVEDKRDARCGGLVGYYGVEPVQVAKVRRARVAANVFVEARRSKSKQATLAVLFIVTSL